jgi:hypothetical protein
MLYKRGIVILRDHEICQLVPKVMSTRAHEHLC